MRDDVDGFRKSAQEMLADPAVRMMDKVRDIDEAAVSG